MILDFGGGFTLRRATDRDHAAFCDICLRTGDAGRDATWREDDPALMGQIYAVPYQVLEPELAFAIDGAAGVAGYLFGVLDTGSFNKRLASDWYPALRRRVADPGPDPKAWRGSDWARRAIHHTVLSIPEVLLPYPSHAHIDLLPAARGRGIGSRSMRFLDSTLAKAGSTGIFLDVHPRNREAQRFYAAHGYKAVAGAGNADSALFMAKTLA